MWSLGVIMYSMVSGSLLFPIESHVLYKQYVRLIGDPEYMERRLRRIRGDVSKDVHDLLSRMLEVDPQKRITAQEALSHPFFQESNRDTGCDDISGIGARLFDLDVIEKMEKFVMQPQLKRAGMIAVAHLIGTEDEESRLQRMTFRQLDKLGRGSLSAADLVSGCQEHGVKVPFGFGETIFPSMLDAREGTAHGLNFVEFLAATLELHAGRHDKVIEGAFRLLDENGSGTLEVGDFLELFPGNSSESLEAMVSESAPSGQMTFEEFHRLMTEDPFPAESAQEAGPQNTVPHHIPLAGVGAGVGVWYWLAPGTVINA
jgi:calcium-dependent protein kinase